ncbi:MAG TPA: hypothetical protein VF412_17035 [Bdellovibrio sp.]|uniref:hypothetical protein n=1 Tax=Bdellovibrio sp. TaxID=28201 RepID=UPI002EFFEFC2
MKYTKFFQGVLLGILFFAIMFAIEEVDATKLGAKQRSLPCDENKTQKIRVALGRLTVLSFPVKPKEILPGESSFDFKQIKNDLAIKALRANAKTNVFVYMAERRCAFDVVTVPSQGDDIIFIKDPEEDQFEVNFK